MEDNNEAFPQDIQTEILLRLPVKSIGKCICVSKKWAALILDKYFRDRYNFLQSMTRPRLLFMLSHGEDVANVLFRRNQHAFFPREDPNVLFHSVYQEKEPLLSSGQQQTYITLEPESHVWAILRGLVCIISPYKMVLCNLSTKKFLALPEIRERYQDRDVAFNSAYLGYDEASNVFKVLCLMTKKFDNNRRMDFRVFTIGSGEDCCRKIVYNKFEHLPVTKGICKDGVLYYGAKSISDNVLIVISFNLRSEELNVIEVPKRVETMIGSSLVNYNGEIALVDWLMEDNGEFMIWVRNEVAGDWREEHIVIPSWIETVGEDWCRSFCFKGTIGTGELVFARDGYVRGSMFVLYYDTITQHLRKFEIDGVANDYVSTYLDHVDSLLLM